MRPGGVQVPTIRWCFILYLGGFNRNFEEAENRRRVNIERERSVTEHLRSALDKRTLPIIWSGDIFNHINNHRHFQPILSLLTTPHLTSYLESAIAHSISMSLARKSITQQVLNLFSYMGDHGSLFCHLSFFTWSESDIYLSGELLSSTSFSRTGSFHSIRSEANLTTSLSIQDRQCLGRFFWFLKGQFHHICFHYLGPFWSPTNLTSWPGTYIVAIGTTVLCTLKQQAIPTFLSRPRRRRPMGNTTWGILTIRSP